MRRVSVIVGAVCLGWVVGVWAQQTPILRGSFNAETSGNTLTLPFLHVFPGSICESGTPFSGGWSSKSMRWPAPVCIEGTNVTTAAAEFADADNDHLQYLWRLPTDWTGALDVALYWRTSATSGNVAWSVATACIADAETIDPALNTAQTITDAAKGTTLQINLATLTSLTTTGCAAGELLVLDITRTGSHGSDTISASAQLLYAELTYRRAI